MNTRKIIFATIVLNILQLEAAKPEMPRTKKPVKHEIQTFDLANNLRGLSSSQIDQHKKLYEGYVNKWNEIEKNFLDVNRANSAGITYSAFRSLKIAETFARNGSLLHELYFENLGKGVKPGAKTKKLMEANFGSWQAFIDDATDCALCARGWVLTCYNLDSGTVTNYVLEAHNETVPVLALPLLVIDVYEHAYMIDFGIKRADYVKVLWENINWDVVEERVSNWVR